MVYQLPAKLPDELVIGPKTYKRVGGSMSVSRGVCKSNNDGWHYYFNKNVVDVGGPIGHRRHFSLRLAKGRRVVHISMKPNSSAGKNDDIMIWYHYDECWNGHATIAANTWGRTWFNGKDADRVAKGVDLLTGFLEAMTAIAEGGNLPPIQPTLSPQVHEILVEDLSPEIAEPAKPTVAFVLPKADDWEELAALL